MKKINTRERPSDINNLLIQCQEAITQLSAALSESHSYAAQQQLQTLNALRTALDSTAVQTDNEEQQSSVDAMKVAANDMSHYAAQRLNLDTSPSPRLTQPDYDDDYVNYNSDLDFTRQTVFVDEWGTLGEVS